MSKWHTVVALVAGLAGGLLSGPGTACVEWLGGALNAVAHAVAPPPEADSRPLGSSSITKE